MNAAGYNVNIFNPCMYFFVRFPFALATATSVQLSFRATYYLTFRNPQPFDSIPVGAASAASVSAPIADEAIESVKQPVSTSEFIDGDPHLLAGHNSPPLVQI